MLDSSAIPIQILSTCPSIKPTLLRFITILYCSDLLTSSVCFKIQFQDARVHTSGSISDSKDCSWIHQPTCNSRGYGAKMWQFSADYCKVSENMRRTLKNTMHNDCRWPQWHMIHCCLKLCINTYNSFHYAVHWFLGEVMVRSIYFKLGIPTKECYKLMKLNSLKPSFMKCHVLP